MLSLHTMPPKEMQATSEVPPPMSIMILPSGAIAIGVAYFRYRRSRKETAA